MLNVLLIYFQRKIKFHTESDGSGCFKFLFLFSSAILLSKMKSLFFKVTTANQTFLQQHGSKWKASTEMTCGTKSKQENQNRIEIANEGSFVYLVMFVKLIFR